MKPLDAFTGLLGVMILVGATAAQTRPDFSGVWKPTETAIPPTPPTPPSPPTEPPLGRPAPPPPPRTLSMTITQTATDFRIERRVEAGGREMVHTFSCKIDGSESVNQIGSIVLKTTASWNGDSLVLSSAASVEDKPLGQIKDVYRLEGGELIIETTRQTPAGTFTSKAAHRKN
jgi:hypothetical protein